MKPVLTISEHNNPITRTITRIKIAALVVVTLLTLSSKSTLSDSTSHLKSKGMHFVSLAIQGDNLNPNN